MEGGGELLLNRRTMADHRQYDLQNNSHHYDEIKVNMLTLLRVVCCEQGLRCYLERIVFRCSTIKHQLSESNYSDQQ